MKETIFFDGLYSNEVHESAPEFILGKGSIHVDKMIKFLSDNKQYAVNGYLDYTILRSKNAGNRYAVLDTYRFDKSIENPSSESPQQAVKPTIVHQGQEIDVSDIPF